MQSEAKTSDWDQRQPLNTHAEQAEEEEEEGGGRGGGGGFTLRADTPAVARFQV